MTYDGAIEEVNVDEDTHVQWSCGYDVQVKGCNGERFRAMQLTLVVKLCSVALIIALTASADAFELTQPPREEWPTYGGSFSNQRFSQLAQITRDNVRHLRVKWPCDIR